MGQAEVGRIAGIPIVLDASFILLFVLFGMHYFTSGSSQAISYGLLLVTGLALSILLHELGHAFAGRLYGIGTTHIELNGLGGLCYYDRHMPIAAIPRTVMALAGPAVNLVLWLVCDGASTFLMSMPSATEDVTSAVRFASLLDHLGELNFIMLWFNLLPSHPLDGGTALASMLGPVMGREKAMRLIAYTGMLVAGYCAWMVLQGNYFAVIIAFYLYQVNQNVLDTHRGGPTMKRWN
jgi:Zn-dependent protease